MTYKPLTQLAGGVRGIPSLGKSSIPLIEEPQGGGFFKGVQKVFGGLADTFPLMSNEQMAVMFGQIAQAITANVPQSGVFIAGKIGEQMGRERAYQKASQQLSQGIPLGAIDTRAVGPEGIQALQQASMAQQQIGLRERELTTEEAAQKSRQAYEAAIASSAVPAAEQVRLRGQELAASARPFVEVVPSGYGEETGHEYTFNLDTGKWDKTVLGTGRTRGFETNDGGFLNLQRLNDMDWKAIKFADEYARNLVGQTTVDENGRMIFTFTDPKLGESQYKEKLREMLVELVNAHMASSNVFGLANSLPSPAVSKVVEQQAAPSKPTPRYPSPITTRVINPLKQSLGPVGAALSKAYEDVTGTFKGRVIEEGTFVTLDEVRAAIADKRISEDAGTSYVSLYFDEKGNYIGKPRSKKTIGVARGY